MGCAACFKQKSVTEPSNSREPHTALVLRRLLDTARPCKMVSEPELNSIISVLRRHSRMNRMPDAQQANISEPEPADADDNNPPQLSEPEVVRLKWKIALFCTGFDFYDSNWQPPVTPEYSHPCFAQIEKDLHRTFPDNPLFQSPQGISALKRVLQNFALFFPTVGYTQGINYIAGYLLITGYNEAESFWMLVHMAQHPKFFLLGLFEDGFPLTFIYCQLFHFLFRKNLPLLAARFADLGISDELWIFQWFMTYYLYRVPLDIVKHIWNMILLRGSLGLVYFAYALVQALESELSKCEDETQIAGLFTCLRDLETCNEHFKIQEVIERAFQMSLSDQEIFEVLSSSTPIGQGFYRDYLLCATDKERKQMFLGQWHVKLVAERTTYKKSQIQETTGKHIFQYKKREIKFRVSSDIVKIEHNNKIKVENNNSTNTLRRSESIRLSDDNRSREASNNNSDSKNNKGSKKDDTLSQLDKSEHLPSEESIMEIITPETQRPDLKTIKNGSMMEEDQHRLNASVHVIKPAVDHAASQDHPSDDIVMYDLTDKQGFKKKKMNQNQNSKLGRGFKKTSQKTLRNTRTKLPPSGHESSVKIVVKLDKFQSSSKSNKSRDTAQRQALHSIENQDRSVVEFGDSSIMASSHSEKRREIEIQSVR